jgi:two-component system, OmpR family, sensor histidine kinase ArlS
MIKSIRQKIIGLPWQTKLVLSGSTAIFLTFSIFSILEYHTVANWMLKREEIAVNRTITDIGTYYKEKSNTLTTDDIKKSKEFLRKMNDKDQLIRVYDKQGKVIVYDKNGIFTVLEPTPVNSRTTEEVSVEGKEALVARLPLKGNHFEGTLEVFRQLNNYVKMMDRFFWVMTFFGIAAILFSALSGFFLAKQLLAPVRDLANAMKRIKESGFQGRMEVYRHKDELTDLINLFNEMMDEIEKSFLKQKQFVEDASHELRTPVSILEGHLSLLQRWGKKDPAILEESLETSLQELSRLKKLIIDLLELTRAENSRTFGREKAFIPKVLQQLVKNLEIIHPNFQFNLEINEPLPQIAMSEQHLHQIMIILLDNSIKYSKENKTIKISVVKKNHNIEITVKDNGIGIPSEHMTDVFNRFYRIDKARSRENGGTGLGLSIAKKLIEKNNGKIILESAEGIGTAVRIILPSAKEEITF